MIVAMDLPDLAPGRTAGSRPLSSSMTDRDGDDDGLP
jgi:hypothetical protein